MAIAIKSLASANQIKLYYHSIFYTIVRSHWSKDFKPGPCPRTKEDRKAAAKKYYLLPEEYQTYYDDGVGYGDYPKLPAGPDGWGIEAKDPYYPYDLPELKRNFNEPLHAEADLYGEDRYSQPAKLRYSMLYYFTWCLGSLGSCALIYYWFEDKKMFRPVLPKQYPTIGKKHYTFEPAK